MALLLKKLKVTKLFMVLILFQDFHHFLMKIILKILKKKILFSFSFFCKNEFIKRIFLNEKIDVSNILALEILKTLV